MSERPNCNIYVIPYIHVPMKEIVASGLGESDVYWLQTFLVLFILF